MLHDGGGEGALGLDVRTQLDASGDRDTAGAIALEFPPERRLVTEALHRVGDQEHARIGMAGHGRQRAGRGARARR